MWWGNIGLARRAAQAGAPGVLVERNGSSTSTGRSNGCSAPARAYAATTGLPEAGAAGGSEARTALQLTAQDLRAAHSGTGR